MEQVPETAPAAAPYQVFINHRGPDVKKTLASLIYNRLTKCHGLSVFLDEKEIHTGATLSPAIIGAIQSASVHVCIFSGRYAESSWCLNELYWILRSHNERNTEIIPVFYDVEPLDLRRIDNGRYAEDFEKHQRKDREPMEVIKNWKTALNQASEISGQKFKTNESDSGEILEKIVDSVLKEVFKREALEVAKYPVGLDQEDFRNEILNHSHSNATKIVGIAGLGGVGKSTLAEYFYNLRRPHFRRSSILFEVGKRSWRSSQEKLLRDLLGNYNPHHINSISQGKRILRDCLRRLPPVFIVLDDVDHISQIESVLDVDAVASGSPILITSRDKYVLIRSSAKTIVYDVKTLHRNHARELFCRHAFSQSKPSEELYDLIEEFLKICGGLPLSLKVLGGLLSGRCDKDYWERQLEKLSTTMPNQIRESLLVSYEALDPVEKEVFLDIGCFLVGEEKELAIRVLEGLHDSSRIGDYLESLHQKCLVNFDYVLDDYVARRKREYPRIGYNYTCLSITMHDQLRELARHIAREEFRLFPTRNPLRVSSFNDIHEMLRSQVGSTLQIRGVRSWECWMFNGKSFKPETRVEGVRLLVYEHEGLKPVSNVFERLNMSGELVWLRLSRSRISCCLRSVSLRRLRVLEINGHDIHDGQCYFDEWDPLDPRPNTLTDRSTKVEQPESSEQGMSWPLQPLHSFSRFLENRVTGMISLTKLVLRNLGFLQSLPIDFSQLPNLRLLDLSGCSKLSELPKTFSELLQLQYLALQECFTLTIPLDILGEISTLEYVDFKDCAKLVCLPERIPYQRHLRYLNLRGTDLLQLPENLAILDKLEQLTIGSPVLHEIPVTVANLRGLTELFLIQCSGLRRILPEGIAAPNIKIFAIDGCSIDNFSFQDQGILDAQNIHFRVGMRFLRDFILTNTSVSRISIPDCVAPRLETIDLSKNIQLMSVDALPSALVRLNLQYCCELKTLTSLSNLVNLKFLNINRCFNLETLNIESLASLDEIKAEECWKLQRIQGLNRLERLNCVHISTDNRVIWNDLCVLLRSPAHQKPSTAIFSGGADNYKKFNKGDMLRIAEKFDLQILDICFYSGSDGSTFAHELLDNFHSHTVILMFFITDNVKSRFRVTFTPGIGRSQSLTLEYSSFTRSRDGRGVHVFMWRKESRLFKKYSVYGDIQVHFSRDMIQEASSDVDVSFSWNDMTEQPSSSDVDEDEEGFRVKRLRLKSSRNVKKATWTEIDGLVSRKVEEERGWILMVDNETDVSEICGEFIRALT